MGQTACAITDHGVMYGCVAFFDAARAAGIKPIIGCEVYVATRTRFDKVNKIDGNNHLILLCNCLLYTSPQDLENISVEIAEVNRPGLFLAGYYDYFAKLRLQIMGLAEMNFLAGLP